MPAADEIALPVFVSNAVFEGNHPRVVDLGLSVKWASCNVGAESPEEYGDYFAWGGTYHNYSNSISITHGLSISELESRGIIGADGNLTAAYDAAAVNWGGSWRMPTSDEIQELVNDCEWKWTSIKGVNGRLVTGPNGNSIFLPVDGFRYSGYYWSATPYGWDDNNAYHFGFYSDDYDWSHHGYRDHGHMVRPVSE